MRSLLSAVLLCTAGAQAAACRARAHGNPRSRHATSTTTAWSTRIYDTELKVTWLADANMPLTSGYDTHIAAPSR
jgi:hypothetical protein